MENQKTTKEEQTRLPPEEPGEGDNEKPVDKVERAEQVAKRLEETEKRIDEKLKKLKDEKANQLLSGTAGGRVETTPKQETDAEYRARIEREVAEGKL